MPQEQRLIAHGWEGYLRTVYCAVFAYTATLRLAINPRTGRRSLHRSWVLEWWRWDGSRIGMRARMPRAVAFGPRNRTWTNEERTAAAQRLYPRAALCLATEHLDDESLQTIGHAAAKKKDKDYSWEPPKVPTSDAEKSLLSERESHFRPRA